MAVDSAPVDGGKGSSEDLPSIGNEKIIELDEDKASLLVENLEEITQIYRSASDLLVKCHFFLFESAGLICASNLVLTLKPHDISCKCFKKIYNAIV